MISVRWASREPRSYLTVFFSCVSSCHTACHQRLGKGGCAFLVAAGGQLTLETCAITCSRCPLPRASGTNALRRSGLAHDAQSARWARRLLRSRIAAEVWRSDAPELAGIVCFFAQDEHPALT